MNYKICIYATALSLLCSIVSAGGLRSTRNEPTRLIPDANGIISVPLQKKVMNVSDKEDYLKLISINQKILSDLQTKNPNFLEKSSDKQSILGKTTEFSEIKLGNHKNTQFTGYISVGDSDDVYEVIFDTGSLRYCAIDNKEYITIRQCKYVAQF